MVGNIPLVIAVNAGAPAGVQFEGVQYQADRYAIGGAVASTNDTIGGVAEGKLYQTERYGSFNYEIPVTNGSYTVKLHMAEIYQEEAGQRLFNVDIENSTIFTELDLYSRAGHDGAFSHVASEIAVNDGKLTIKLNGVVSNATIAGFAVYSANGAIDNTVPERDCKGYIGLTFDDGPTSNTRAFVNRLRDYGLSPVTFFVNGRNIDDPSVIREMMSVGEIQNHGYSHSRMTNLTKSQVLDELRKTNEAIRNAGAPVPTLFRPPYGARNNTVTQAASELNLYTLTWDADSKDWNGASSAQIVRAANALQDGQNILMHENQRNTINANTLSQIAENIKAKGLCLGLINPATGRVTAP